MEKENNLSTMTSPKTILPDEIKKWIEDEADKFCREEDFGEHSIHVNAQSFTAGATSLYQHLSGIVAGPMNNSISGWKTGIELIAEERLRQVEVEGWTPEHDTEHVNAELAIAAACYAINKLPGIRVQVYLEAESGFLSGNTGDRGDRQLRKAGWYDAWPWEEKWDKRERHDRRKSLIAAGALIAAELDRLQKLNNNE